MGIYYKIACDEAKECLDPGHINDLGIKSGAIASPDHPFGSVVVYAMVIRWSSPIRLVNDCCNDPGYFEYKDVTEDVLKEYNERYNTELKFTGERDE